MKNFVFASMALFTSMFAFADEVKVQDEFKPTEVEFKIMARAELIAYEVVRIGDVHPKDLQYVKSYINGMDICNDKYLRYMHAYRRATDAGDAKSANYYFNLAVQNYIKMLQFSITIVKYFSAYEPTPIELKKPPEKEASFLA